jgi:hypothetical protein
MKPIKHCRRLALKFLVAAVALKLVEGKMSLLL